MTTNSFHTCRGHLASKNDPAWMLDLRQKAWRFFEEIPWPTGNEETWRRTKLTGFKLEDYQPLTGATQSAAIPAEVEKSLAEIDSIGTLAIVDGATLKYELDPSLRARGVIFSDLHSARASIPSWCSAPSTASSRRTKTSSARSTTRCGTAARSSTCRAT